VDLIIPVMLLLLMGVVAVAGFSLQYWLRSIDEKLGRIESLVRKGP